MTDLARRQPSTLGVLGRDRRITVAQDNGTRPGGTFRGYCVVLTVHVVLGRHFPLIRPRGYSMREWAGAYVASPKWHLGSLRYLCGRFDGL